MGWFDNLLEKIGVKEFIIPVLKVDFGGPTIMQDRQLSNHFTLYQLTATEHKEYQDINRELTETQVEKLRQVAELVETAWAILEYPIIISSGYRCPALNAAVGSSSRSQHMLCEAADMVVRGMATADAFKALRQAAKDGKLKFGQMIYEKAPRGYSGGAVEWVHLSLGAPFRPVERCGQVLTMVDGAYTMIETIAQTKEA